MVSPGCTWYRIVRQREKPWGFGKLSATHKEIKVTVLASHSVPQSMNGSRHGVRYSWHCEAWGKDRSPLSCGKTPASKPWLSPDLYIVTSTGLGL